MPETLPVPVALRVAGAMWRARGEHVARLLDAADAAAGELRLEVADGAFPLSAVLARGLDPGEAVTVLAPLAEVVESLAARGVVHAGVGVESVRLDERGAPVLGSFASATLVDFAQDAENAGIGLDRAAYRALAREVLAAVAGPTGAGWPALLTAAAELDAARRGALTAFADRLRSAAHPEPVRVGGAPVDAAPPVLSSPPPRRRSFASLRMPVVALRARIGRVRPRFWAIAAAMAVALVAAMLLVPGGEDRAVPRGSSAPETVPSPTPRSPSPEWDPVAAVLALRGGALAARIMEDFGDVVLLGVDTVRGFERVLLERTELGWRLRRTEAIEMRRVAGQIPRSAAKFPASRRALMLVRNLAASAPSMIR